MDKPKLQLSNFELEFILDALNDAVDDPAGLLSEDERCMAEAIAMKFSDLLNYRRSL
jgi:hypothetical protein